MVENAMDITIFHIPLLYTKCHKTSKIEILLDTPNSIASNGHHFMATNGHQINVMATASP